MVKLVHTRPSYKRTPTVRSTDTAVDYQMLKTLVLKLPDEQKKLLKDVLALDLKSKPNESERDIELLKAAVTSELKKVVGDSSVTILKGTTSYQALVKAVPVIISFCVSANIPCSTTYEKIKCFNELVGLLVLYAKGISSRVKTPITPQLVLKQVSNLPGIFDSAYPGYVSAGVAHIIFK